MERKRKERGKQKARKAKGKERRQGKEATKGCKERRRGKEARKGGKEKERKAGKEWKGSICGLGLLFEQLGIAKVSLGVSLISPLACTQLCIKQLQMWTLRSIIGIAFGSGGLSLHIMWWTFQTPPDPSLHKWYARVYRTSYLYIIYIYITISGWRYTYPSEK